MIAIVAAMDEARLIGVGGRLPWPHIPADMRHFRALTMGKTVVMGRRTFESIGRVLDGRENVVGTRGSPSSEIKDVWWSHSLRLSIADRDAQRENVFVAGGASVYAAALPLADRLYLTRIRHTFPVGEDAVYFPEWSGFRLTESTHREADAANPYPMEFQTWTRE